MFASIFKGELYNTASIYKFLHSVIKESFSKEYFSLIDISISLLVIYLSFTRNCTKPSAMGVRKGSGAVGLEWPMTKVIVSSPLYYEKERYYYI